MTKTWKELEAEGVQRCCAHFRRGGRCKRRATVVGHLGGSPSWCAKHGRVMEAAIKKYRNVKG